MLLIIRGIVFPVCFILAGAIMALRLLPVAPHDGFRIVPALVLSLALIALGVHRLMTVARLRRTS